MRNSSYAASLILGSCVVLGLVACGGSSDAGGGAGGATATGGNTGNGGIGNTGGTKSSAGASATGGAKAVGGTSAAAGGATGGTFGAGGATTNGGANATGGVTPAGGTNATGGATNGGGASATGGSSGTSVIQQSCSNVAALLASRTTPLDSAAQYDVATCVTTYTKLANANATCGSGYLALLQCGETQPADSWTTFTLQGTFAGTSININIPVPPSTTNTDACYSQFQSLFTTIIMTPACQTAL